MPLLAGAGCDVAGVALVAATEASRADRPFADNAGIEGVIAPIDDDPDETFDQLRAVNVRRAAWVETWSQAHAPAPHGRHRRYGLDIRHQGHRGRPGSAASKRAVLGLTRVTPLDIADSGIRVTARPPGPIETRMFAPLDERAPNVWTARSASERPSTASPRMSPPSQRRYRQDRPSM